MATQQVETDVTSPSVSEQGVKRFDDSSAPFRDALDRSAVIVRAWDGVIRHWTIGCEHLYGWTAKEAVGQICQQLLNTKFTVPLETIQQQLLREGSWKGELEHTRSDGTTLAISAYWVIMREDDGQNHLVIETQTDISGLTKVRRELEDAHDQLKRIRDELERSNEELEEFARITSHDLSAPITSTRWLLDIFQKRHSAGLDADGQKCLAQINQSLARMADLIEGVLAHAKAGRRPISSSVCSDAGEAFAIAVENLASDIEETGAVITHDWFPKVAVEPQALAQLFQNILSNALKYRSPGVSPSIHVSTTRQDSVWLFALRDNGIGIDRQWFDRIFQPMQRLGGANVSGSGIGLATCRKIVRRAGGRIWVESQLGAGSTFLFTLPAAAPSAAAD